MDATTANQFAEIFAAFAAGKTIEQYNGTDWVTITDLNPLPGAASLYRIAPPQVTLTFRVYAVLNPATNATWIMDVYNADIDARTPEELQSNYEAASFAFRWVDLTNRQATFPVV